VDRGQWDSRKAYKAEVMSLSTPLQCAVAAAPHTFLYYTTHHSTHSPLLLFSLFLCLSHGCPFALSHLFGLLLAEREVPWPLLCPRDLDVCFGFVYMEAIFCFASFTEEDCVCILLRFDQGTQEEIAVLDSLTICQNYYSKLHYITLKKKGIK
jgi:hypothetical protein